MATKMTSSTAASPTEQTQQRCWCMDYSKPCTVQERFNSSVPYDKPLSVSCDVEYELDMKLFPGYRDDRSAASGVTHKDLALAVDYNHPKMRQLQPPALQSTSSLGQLHHRHTSSAALQLHHGAKDVIVSEGASSPALPHLHRSTSDVFSSQKLGLTLDKICTGSQHKSSGCSSSATTTAHAQQHHRLQPSFAPPPPHPLQQQRHNTRDLPHTHPAAMLPHRMTSQHQAPPYGLASCEGCLMTSQPPLAPPQSAPLHAPPPPPPQLGQAFSAGQPQQPQYYTRSQSQRAAAAAAAGLAPPAPPPQQQFPPIPMGPMGPAPLGHLAAMGPAAKPVMLGGAAPPVSQPLQGRTFALCGSLNKSAAVQQQQSYLNYLPAASMHVSPQTAQLPPALAAKPVSIQGAACRPAVNASYRRPFTSRQRPSPYDKPPAAAAYCKDVTFSNGSVYSSTSVPAAKSMTTAHSNSTWGSGTLLHLNRDLWRMQQGTTTRIPPHLTAGGPVAVTAAQHSQCCAVY